MSAKFVDPASLPTWTFDWRNRKPLIATDNTDAGHCSLMHVILFPERATIGTTTWSRTRSCTSSQGGGTR